VTGLIAIDGGLVSYRGGLVPPPDGLIAPPKASVANLLLDLDYRTPAAVTKYDTAAAVAAKLGVTASHVKEIWTCDEASGSLVGKVSGYTLAPGGTGSPSYQKSAVGLFNGSDMVSLNAVNFPDGENTYFQDATTTHLDDDGATSRGFFIAYRMFGPPLVGARTFFDKSTSGARYHAYLSSGKPYLIINDGVNPGVATITSNTYWDGAWHFAYFLIDRTANVLKIITDRETVTSASISGVGSLSNATGFRISNPSLHPGMQVAYFVALEGSSAEGVTQADCQALWPHATDPSDGSATKPKLTSYARNSLACPIVGDDATDGVRVAKYGPDAFAHAYKSVFSHATKLGALDEQAATNLILQSEDFTDAAWTTSNASASANAAEAPDGTDTADSITATAGAGYISQSVATSASTDYTGSVFIKRNGSSDVAGRLVLYDVSSGAELAATAFTATSKWQRITVSAATIAGGLSTALRIEITTNGESVFAWGAQVEQWEAASSYIPTTSATATRAVPWGYVAESSPGDYWNSSAGEVECIYSFVRNSAESASDNVLVEAQRSAGGNADRYLFMHAATTQHRLFHYDSAGSIKVSGNKSILSDLTVEVTARYRWDSQKVLSGHAENWDVIANGTRAAGAAVTWTGGSGVMRIAPFGYTTYGGDNINGIKARLRVWATPRGDTP